MLTRLVNWFMRYRGMVWVKEFELDRLHSCEDAWSRVFDACVETGWDTGMDGRAIDNVPAHIRTLKATLDTVTQERDALWLEVDPESAAGETNGR